MKIPAISGVIRRRILLNYRVSPEVAQQVLPEGFRPKVYRGYAIAGVCLIRLEELRPKGMPALIGISCENSAHRIAVEWEGHDGRLMDGVFVPRRDTNTRFMSWAGGRIFPGAHHFSQFQIVDEGGRISVNVLPEGDESPLVQLDLYETDAFPSASIFESLEASSDFFESGCVGYSTRPDSCVLDGLSLRVQNWVVSPLRAEGVRSSYFENRTLFPEGEIAFDHALLMRDIDHEWHSEPLMNVGS
ncbi:MAG: DUF2071 domain-containing protein [Opitutales bacterium]